MTDIKISQLPSATTPLAGTEIFPIVQGGITKSVTIADITAGRSVSQGATVITDNSTGNALRVTQTGTGNAILVEDSANPDSSPFVVDKDGNIGIGTTTPATKFDIYGDTYIRSGLGLAFWNSTNAGYYALYNSSGTLVFTNGSTQLSLDSSGNATLAGGVTATSFNGGQLAGNRNKIINGAMMIDQRNAGASVALTNTENYVIDRWAGTSYGGNSVSFARSTLVPSGSATDKAFANSFSATNGGSTAAGTSSFYTFRHKIEGNNIYDLGLGTASAQSFTVSFWARSSVTGTYVVAILNGAANWGNRSTFTINAANTWEYKTVTFSGTSSGSWVTDNTVGMYLDIVLSAGSNQNSTANTWTSGALESTSAASNTWCATNGATFYITGVQLEKGATATPFENRLYGTELALCGRYYINAPNGTLVANQSNFYVSAQYPVAMRATPTVTTTATSSNLTASTYGFLCTFGGQTGSGYTAAAEL